jgi:two-component system, response regulator PdtaR
MAEPARILLVEDETLSSLYLKIQIEKMGFLVQAVLTTGEEALGLALADPPDLILMDINLSGEMSGIEAAKLIKARFDIPVIFTTGYSDEGIRRLASALEPVAFLVKPLDMKELRKWMLAGLGGATRLGPVDAETDPPAG